MRLVTSSSVRYTSRSLSSRRQEVGAGQDALGVAVQQRQVGRARFRLREVGVVEHPPGDVQQQVRVALQQRPEQLDVPRGIQGRQLARQPHVDPYDRVVGIKAQHLLRQRQIAGRVVVVAQVRVDRQGDAPLAQDVHERRPLADRGRGHRLVAVGELRLLHQVDLAHPPEEALDTPRPESRCWRRRIPAAPGPGRSWTASGGCRPASSSGSWRR